MKEEQNSNEAETPSQTGAQAEVGNSALLALPLHYEYVETGGYDCMSSSYDITDNNGCLIASIDMADIELDRNLCEYGPSAKGEAIARLFVTLANAKLNYEHIK